LASSSAMMRRIEAKISSIEGSWTFAGCVISDSTSSTPSRASSYTSAHFRKSALQPRKISFAKRCVSDCQNRSTGHDKISPIPDVLAGTFNARA
jgi:hypothetical protein